MESGRNYFSQAKKQVTPLGTQVLEYGEEIASTKIFTRGRYDDGSFPEEHGNSYNSNSGKKEREGRPPQKRTTLSFHD